MTNRLMNEQEATPAQDSDLAALAAIDRDLLVKAATELCDVASPTGYEKAAACLFEERMRREGLSTSLQLIAPERANALGTLEGSGGGKTLMLIGHLDTWLHPDENGVHNLGKPPAATLVDDQWVCGLNVSNMKGALASYLAAVSAVKRAGISLAGDVVIAAVAGSMQNAPIDEFQGEPFRGYAVGTQHMLVRGRVADMCVLGEPTNLRIITRNFGSTHARITVSPDGGSDGCDVVESAATVARELAPWLADYQSRKTIEGVVPQAKVFAIKGGTPWRPWQMSSAAIYVHLETPPRELPINTKRELQQAVETIRTKHPEWELSLDVYASNPGAAVADDSPIVTAVRESHTQALGEEPETGVVSWHSDAGHLNRYGIPTVNYGVSPRTGADAAPQELGDCLHIDDLMDITRVYADLIVRVCGGNA